MLKKTVYSLCALILIPSAAFATPVPVVTLNAGASVSTRNGSTTTFQCANSQSNSGPVASFDCGTLALNPAVGAGTGESFATATFGSLSAYATLVAGGGPASNAARVHADAGAYFDDFLMAFRPINGVNTAFTGSFVVDAEISGNATLGGSNGTALGNLQLTVGSQTCSQQIDDLSAQAMFCHIVVPFVANQNIELFLHLSATVDFFVPTSSCVISSSRDRGDHVQLVLFGHCRALLSVFLVHEDVDVLSDRPALVEDPALDVRVLALEGLQHLADGRPVELELPLPSGELRQRSPKPHDRHASILDRITV